MTMANDKLAGNSIAIILVKGFRKMLINNLIELEKSLRAILQFLILIIGLNLILF